MHKWTREETLIALNVYCKIPFKQCHASNPTIIEYAKLLNNRTAAALNLKIGNIGRLDNRLKEHGIVGLTHGSKMDELVWNEFIDNPEKIAYESEQIIALRKHLPIEQSVGIRIDDLPKGTERMRTVKQRVNQNFFRSAVLAAYNNTCCISGVNNISLIEACHISAWYSDEKNRTNPKNGLCLNVFFHKAYDKYLIAITPDMVIKISDKLLEDTTDNNFKEYLMTLQNKKIYKPEKFSPDVELLSLHYEKYKTII